ARAARESVEGAVAAAGGLPGQVADGVRKAAFEAFTSGLHTVALVGAAVVLLLGVLALAAMRGVPPMPPPPKPPKKQKKKGAGKSDAADAAAEPEPGPESVEERTAGSASRPGAASEAPS
ncbi:hypothetical protein DZF91_22870, partial [Actinomadura logoneensis]